MSTPGFGNSGVRMHGPWLAVGSWDWSSGKSLCVFMCVLLCSLCQCLKEMIGSWFQRDWPSGLYLCVFCCLCSGFCFARSQVRVVCVWFCLCVCVGVFVQNTWLEARTRNGTSGKRKSCSCSVNLPCYHVYNMSVCMFLSWCLNLKHTWMIGGQDNLNQDLSLCICLSMMLNVGCMFYS